MSGKMDGFAGCEEGSNESWGGSGERTRLDSMLARNNGRSRVSLWIGMGWDGMGWGGMGWESSFQDLSVLS
jgi:hypothetical protein